MPVTINTHYRHIAAISAVHSARMEILARIQKYDLRLFAKIFRQGERRTVIPLARAVSRSADGYLHLLIPLLLWALHSPALQSLLTTLALALALERTLYWSLKNSLKRLRPQDSLPGFRALIKAADQFSFPSGHTSAAFLLATVLVIVFGGPVMAMYLWASAVGLSRILLGVHFPGDTLAGAAMGSSIAVLSSQLLGL